MRLLTAVFLLIASQVFGQPLITSLTPSPATQPTLGQFVELQLKVTNFTNINSIQFPITYNSAVLELDTIYNSTLPGWVGGNYNDPPPHGTIRITWLPDQSAYPDGVTLPDGTAIFTLRFKALTNGTITVNLANVAPGIEVVRNLEVIQVNYQSGGATVVSGTGGPPPSVGFKIYANTIHIPQGATGCMPVTVNDFTNIASMQYAMHWDNTVLQLQGTQSYNLPSLAAGSFTTSGGPPANTLTLNWAPNPANPTTRANGTKIYDVCFNAVGAIGTSSLITIDGAGIIGGAKATNSGSTNVWTPTSGVTDTIYVVTTPPPPNAVTFTLDKDTTGVGGQACMEVKVKNFTKVISAQFGITYDATKLQLQSPNGIVLGTNPLTLSLGSNFNTNTPGEVRFLWEDPNATGATLPDNTTIFSVCFNVAAPAGEKVNVNFSSLSNFPPLSIEVAKEPDGPVIPAMNSGHVYVSAVVPEVAVQTTAACGGGNSGTATAQVTNGTASTYAWTGPGGFTATTKDISGLAPGNYTVVVTLAGGATITDMGTVATATAITIPTQQLTLTNVSCAGLTDGAISLTVTGGIAPFTYLWDGPGPYTATTEDISGLEAGIYVLSVTDASGCPAFVSQPYQVTAPQPLSVTLETSVNVACFGASTGGATINVTGGTPTFSYSWKTGGGQLVSTSKNPTDLKADNYNVTVTDSRGCTDALDNPVVINGPTSALAVASPIQKTDVLCYGYNTGAINLGISGGWSGNYTVNWSPTIPGGANPINIPGGTYLATVTDQGGCTFTTQPVQVQQPPAFEYTGGTPTVDHIECAGKGDGSITIQLTGGNGGPYTVNWGTLSGTTISNLAGGNYTPTVTDVNGCTFVMPVVPVNEPAPIAIDSEVITDPSGGQPNGAVALTVVGGTGTLDFSWTGPGPFTANTEDISNLNPGAYTLVVTDDNNCSFTKIFEVGGALSAVPFLVDSSCGTNGAIQINITSGVPPFQVTWNGGTGPYLTNDFSFTINTFAPGLINITIADAASNVIVLPPVNVPSLPGAIVSDAVTQPNQALANGSITLTPVPLGTQLTYDWSGPGVGSATSSTITNLDSGFYQVTVTNVSSGCTSTASWTLVRQWPPLAPAIGQVSDPNCTYSADGSITVAVTGGNPNAYSYAWSGPNGPIPNINNATLSNIGAGTYTCTVTDGNGTTGTITETLESESQLDVTNVNVTSNYQGYPVSGANSCDGVANVAFSGGVGAVSVLWSNNVGTIQNNTLCAGPYSVIVTDANGCTAAWEGTLTSPAAISSAPSIVSGVTCHDECDGIARVTINGGIAPYTVKWSTGQIDQGLDAGDFSQAVNLCGGSYKVTITDKIGGTLVAPVDVIAPDPITITFADIDPTKLNSCDGELLVEAPAAVAPVTYAWSGSLGHNGDTELATGLCAGEIVQFVLVDANGCTGIGVDTVDYPVDGCYQVRPVITPGEQDGNNDFVFITCAESVPNAIEIYNRWGQLVFETKNYDNGSNVWRGFSKNGQPLAEGVYYYVLNVTDPVTGQLQFKGHINLLR